MKLIFEKSVPGRRCTILPPCDVDAVSLPESLRRETKPDLPQLSETDISRHYTELCHQVHGVNCGFYPLGSCTMKYNPRIDEEMAALPGFTNCHPLAPRESLAGMRHVLDTAREYLCEITGMDGMTFQPAAGAHGEFTGVLLIKQYHDARGDHKRTKIIVPDSAHGTNPATAAMCGYEVVNIASGPDGCVDLDSLRSALGDDTAGLMLTNPNTVGIFDKNILEITRLVQEKDIPVIFTEVNGSDATANAISRETGCQVAQLTMLMDGPEEGDLSTYLEGVRSNVNTIVSFFGGEELDQL